MSAHYSLDAIPSLSAANAASGASTAKPMGKRYRLAGAALAVAAIAALAGAQPSFAGTSTPRQQPQGPTMTVTPGALASGGLYMSLANAANVVNAPQVSAIYLQATGYVSLEFTAIAGRAYQVSCSFGQHNQMAWQAKLNGQPFGGQAKPDNFATDFVFATPNAPAAGQIHIDITQPSGGPAYTLLNSCSVYAIA